MWGLWCWGAFHKESEMLAWGWDWEVISRFHLNSRVLYSYGFHLFFSATVFLFLCLSEEICTKATLLEILQPRQSGEDTVGDTTPHRAFVLVCQRPHTLKQTYRHTHTHISFLQLLLFTFLMFYTMGCFVQQTYKSTKDTWWTDTKIKNTHSHIQTHTNTQHCTQQ